MPNLIRAWEWQSGVYYAHLQMKDRKAEDGTPAAGLMTDHGRSQASSLKPYTAASAPHPMQKHCECAKVRCNSCHASRAVTLQSGSGASS